jgi:group II intron reverse transcriptase/maturase
MVDREARFSALLGHVDADRLGAAYAELNPRAATGIDGVTWASYGQDRGSNLQGLLARVHRGGYRAKPTSRAWIPKSGGRERPLGIAALEDKLLQRAVVEVLNGIYETDFVGFSYGFRPGRSAHDALDALAAGIYDRKVNWVLDADIRDFFGSLDHGWLMRFLEHRVADRRVLRLIGKWLAAGVIEDGAWSQSERGAPREHRHRRGWPNVYLHYVFDLWAHPWRRRQASGEVIIVRYADDYIVGFQHQRDAQRFLVELRDRLARFGLELAAEKTRLIEFGRFAAENRSRRGQPKPETFDFLGFRHICSKTRNGRFHAQAHHDRCPDAGQAARDQDRAAQTPASPDPRTGQMARERRQRPHGPLRRPGQRRRDDRLPRPSHAALAQIAQKAKPAPQVALDADTPHRRALATAGPTHAPLPQRPL